MGAFGQFIADIFETGSRVKEGQGADPRMVRYGSTYYPENVGIEMVVLDLEDLRQDAKMEEPRLSVELEDAVISFDLALQTKASESGRRLFDMAKDDQIKARDYVRQSQQDDIDSMNYTKDKRYDGNKNYR